MTDSNPAWPQTRDGVFATTQWTLIAEAARDGDVESARAMERLCGRYWPPVYAFIRRRGHLPEEAKDLTQGFFAHLLDKRAFGEADPQCGKFRTYLLGAVKHFLSNEYQKSMAQKRGGGMEHWSIDADLVEASLAGELMETTTPETLFERQWARTVLADVQQRLRAEFAKREKAALFDELQPLLTGGSLDLRYADIAARHGGTTASVKMAVKRMRNRFAELLREAVVETLPAADDVDAELRHLVAAFRE